MQTPRQRRTMVVTGASLGIGRAIAARFSAAGHDVVMIARDGRRLATAATELRRQAPAGCAIVPLSLDVTRDDAADQIEKTLLEHGLTADIIVNNAGIGLGGHLITQPPADLDRLIALNITATTRLSRHFAARFSDAGRGSIINVASLGGYVPGPNQAAYYASKAYVLSLSEALASEVAASGVHVMAVAPGPVDTSIHASMRAERAPYRLLLPAMSPASIANATYWGWRLGRRVVVPGLHYQLLAVALRVLPHRLIVPLVGALLKPTDR